jgi:hypothetical protein
VPALFQTAIRTSTHAESHNFDESEVIHRIPELPRTQVTSGFPGRTRNQIAGPHQRSKRLLVVDFSRDGILTRVRRIDHVATISLPNLKHVVFPPFAGVGADDFEINPSCGRRLQGRDLNTYGSYYLSGEELHGCIEGLLDEYYS